MTTTEEVWTERDWLLSLCFRLLGTMAEAEDAVQETYVRWLRLDDADRESIRVPAAWLRRTATRICLDVLGSARARRERYVGDWLPEPLPADTTTCLRSSDPAGQALLQESVSMAMLVVLDRMTPAERVAFVLHEVFAVPLTEVATILDRSDGAARQLAASARRRVDADVGPVVTSDHDRVVRAFQRATGTGDVEELLTLLAPGITLRSDGGGIVRAARNPLHGADRLARFLLGILAKNDDLRLDVHTSAAGQAVLVLRRGPEVTGVMSFAVADGVATAAWFQVNPEKLTGWTTGRGDAQARR